MASKELHNMEKAKANVFAAVVVALFSAIAAEIPLEIKNAGFEKVGKDGYPEGWSRHKDWHGERIGHNGSGGMVFERKEAAPPSRGRPGQPITLKPGKRYYISALVKAENIQTLRKTHAMGMTIHLEGYNANRKWVFGTIARPCVSGTSKDWVKVEGVTPVISESITSAFIQPLAHGCVSGYGVVDNIYVAELETKPVGAIFSDAYRNESAGGKVKFSAALDIDRKTSLEEYSVEFAHVDEGGRTVKTACKVASHSDATVELDTDRFAYGTNDVVCTLSRGGKEIGSASLRFARLKSPTPRKVYIDRNRMTIVDGKPFFPLGMFYSAGMICESNMNLYAQAPFNCVMPYGFRLNRRQMDLCESKGIKVIWDLRLGLDSPDAGKKAVEEKVAMFKDHPALLAWYTNDERPVADIPRLKLRQEWMEVLDKDHPTWSVQDVFREARHYLGTYDVLGMDPYPVPKKPIGTVISSMRQGTSGTFASRAIWQVPQAFGWGWLGRKERQGQRGPNKAEMANMTWQSIAGGANGIVYYAFHTLRRANRFEGDSFELAWERTKAAAFEVKKYEHVLTSLEAPPKFTGGTDAVAVRTWRHKGDVYMLAVNCTATPQEAEVCLDAETDKGMTADFGPAPKIENGKIRFSFGPIGYVMLRFRQ